MALEALETFYFRNLDDSNIATTTIDGKKLFCSSVLGFGGE